MAVEGTLSDCVSSWKLVWDRDAVWHLFYSTFFSPLSLKHGIRKVHLDYTGIRALMVFYTIERLLINMRRGKTSCWKNSDMLTMQPW